ncbi:MAG: ATP-binding protein, partial [bacterium]|nr:ATP-binding protein [bacterium]
LFLDEFPEFERRVIETLRQPLEERVVSISRAKGSAEFPADFILIAAMNPCPCGNFNIKGKDCRCTPIEIARYQKKISGPIIDRIDLWLEVGQIDHEKLARKDRGEPTAAIQERVHAARERQAQRFFKHKRGIKRNSQMNARDIEHLIELNQETQEALTAAAKKLDLSARAYHRVIKLARTIADLEGDAHVKLPHLLEALQYRPKLGSSY